MTIVRKFGGGLALGGAGGVGETCSMTIHLIWETLYWAWILTEVLVLVVTRTRRGGGEVQDRGSLIVLWFTIFGAMFVGSWLGAVYQPAMFTVGHRLQYVCVGLLAVGLVIRWSAIYTLGKSFSANVAIHSTQRLNQSGLFRVVRHPSYSGLLLIFLAMGLNTHNWLGLGIIVLLPAAALVYRIHVEEVALTGAFGAEYVEYSQRAKRLIPGIY
jgi:protein-S-isoprenylcysteine O-methyltransferase Ste14